MILDGVTRGQFRECTRDKQAGAPWWGSRAVLPLTSDLPRNNIGAPKTNDRGPSYGFPDLAAFGGDPSALETECCEAVASLVPQVEPCGYNPNEILVAENQLH